MFRLPSLGKLVQLIRMSRRSSLHRPPDEDRVIYEERVFNRNHTLIFTGLALFFLFLAVRIGPDGYLPIRDRDMFFPFFLMLVIAVNFSVLKVRVTFWGLFLRFGILHYETPWTEVKGVYITVPSKKRLFKGWGITVTSIKDGMRLSYRIPGKPEAVCRMRSKLFNEVAFSTLRPEVTLTALKEGMARSTKIT